MSSGDLSCADLCAIVEGHFSTAACLYTPENSGQLGETVHCEGKRFVQWAVEFEKSDALEAYFRYDKPALVCIRMSLQNLGVALATLSKISRKGVIKGLCNKLNPFSRSDKANIQTLVEDIASENSMLQYLAGTAKHRANFAAGIAKGAAAEVTVEEVPAETDFAAAGLTKACKAAEVRVEEIQVDEICLME
ncbi:hypothetical protein ASPVEDRAFT_35992 [Aspergillus versicolor CBS 583.65]|uniref:Uncharacterized protein n=1 Tax=Aspergillus versicolor CBS 583.65 TaxID=1036611 RepID=A0A1L9P526_ASPVE|nr:uncharacterized protein ASPVEDRAFT_35992 [Aspergillus versicolor CBS 583.65]OJI96596.1 hypothetical protein ASPVEDRAFT_35992 [Aspergillus versicolor CBS 583.65]